VDGLAELYKQRQELASFPGAHGGLAARNGIEAFEGSAADYEPPRITVIGNVRDLTGGSASSGKSDANSQYYW
jgi:hypothetical protein